MIFLPTWAPWAGLLLVASHAAVFVGGCTYEQDKAKAALVDAQAKADQIERNWVVNTQAQQEIHNEEISRIARERDAALDGVRNLRAERGAAPARPRVLPGPATANFG